MSLKRDRSGNMILRFWTNGHGSKREYFNLGPITHDKAKERAAEIQAEAHQRKTLADPGITFGRLVELWKKLRAAELADGSKASNESILVRHVLPRLGSVPVEDLRPADLMSYRVDRLAEKKPPAAWSMNRELALIGSVLNFGAVSGITKNPIPRGAVKPLATEIKTVYFEPEEWDLFIRTAERSETPEIRASAAVWRFQLLTASRVGEVAGLRWNAIDSKGGTVTVYQPKTRAPKTLGLSRELQVLLRSIQAGVGQAFVFLDENGAPWRTSRLKDVFVRVLEEAGMADGPWTSHAIRHTAATWARRAGVPLDRISEILGHKDPKMVLRYAHVRVEDLAGVQDAIARAAQGAGTNGGQNQAEKPAKWPIPLTDGVEGGGFSCFTTIHPRCATLPKTPGPLGASRFVRVSVFRGVRRGFLPFSGSVNER